jgi:hypothetical protein
MPVHCPVSPRVAECTAPMITRLWLGLLPVALAACSSTPSNPGTGQQQQQADEAGTVGCSGQGDTYSANLAKPGANAVYTFTLVSAVPAPPDLNGNVWTLKIVDKSGASPPLSQVIVYPYMPLIGHGSDQTPTVTSNADGTFTATDIYLFMPGYWQMTVKVAEPSDADVIVNPATVPIVDQANFSFCI